MLGAGGLGNLDSCLTGDSEVGTVAPMFYGNPINWGNYAGGIADAGSCVSASATPICYPNAPDNVQDLCMASFNRFLRFGTGNTNNSSPMIKSFCPVKCPQQLYEATGLHRLDEIGSGFTCSANQTQYGGRLQRYMDCQRPQYADSNLINGTVDPLFPVVVPCRRDGYSRINSLPPVPTINPTPEPSLQPSSEPTQAPTFDELCCLTSNYADGYWQGCVNAADPTIGTINSCANCIAYACLDWLPGSADMIDRATMYFDHTYDNVYFGVGSFGADSTKGGLCYRITASGVDRDLIAQVITTDNGDGNFHLMVAGGGLGGENACTIEGSSVPLFESTENDWGNLYGGWSFRDQCALLPTGPYCSPNPKDNLQDLCRWSFDKGLRLENLLNSNPTITNICEVTCPTELWSATGVHRVDTNVTDYTCSGTPKKTTAQLARYMDCGKPQFAWGGIAGVTDPSYPQVIPCRRDGYARVNSVPTMPPTNWPSYVPSASNEPTVTTTSKPSSSAPTITVTSSYPTLKPSYQPSVNALCCEDYVYPDYVWPYCKNAADTTIKQVTSCATCMSYQCLDWNVFSSGMTARENAYLSDTGDRVYFGVGSYGSDTSRAGLCYRMSVTGVDRDLIAQVITQGGNVPDGNFNLMMSDGGFSDDYNACSAGGSALPQFAGNSSLWGGPTGGWINSTGCNNVPPYPFCSSKKQDNMRTLCQLTFAKGLRLPNNVSTSNPLITKMCQVKCPSYLWQATGLHRADEKNKMYQCSATNLEPKGGKLSRSMDCSKPSYGWGPINGLTYNTSSTVIPCRRDGYTRINANPTSMPTIAPSASPTREDNLCCANTVYADYQWPYCKNPADPTLTVPSCAAENCVAYQCIDWNVLSQGMTSRALEYKAKTKDDVYFGVGSYGSDVTRAGFCYRITTAEIDKDLIVQVITKGGDTPDGYFNLLMADGGFSDQYTACSRDGSPVPQFSGSSALWGGPQGGWANITGCQFLPSYPSCGNYRVDDLKQLCRSTFLSKFRLPNASDSQPHILNMCQVACPSQLWQATGLHRADEGTNSFKCGAKVEPSGGLLSRSMDCAKPTYAWGPIQGKTYNGSNLVIPCRRDGYTRINTLASAQPSRAPTLNPTVTHKPTFVTTSAPSIDPLCCPLTSYADAATWKTCNNAASSSMGRVSSCKTCLAYQCLDWTAGSVAMQAREAAFYNRTGLNVHFGVGSYSNDPKNAGNCYRISVQGVKLDLLVQAINQGAPAASGNFEMLMGDGGFAGNQACIIGSGANVPMYPGNASVWGSGYGYNGGWNSYFGCNKLPQYPICGDNPQDNLRDLCKWSFTTGLRFVSGRPYITSMCQVACPVELYSATGIHRLDEPSDTFSCGTDVTGGGNLNRYMDCGKPSFAWTGTAQGKLDPEYPIVIPCKRDGYSRINSLPNYPPSNEPTWEPTFTAIPTVQPVDHPTRKPAVANVTSEATKRSQFYFLVSTTKGYGILSALGFVLLVILIIIACEYSLRVTRRRQLLERVAQKRRTVMETNNQRRAELLEQLNASAPPMSAIELRRSYSAYQKINRSLIDKDQTDIVVM